MLSISRRATLHASSLRTMASAGLPAPASPLSLAASAPVSAPIARPRRLSFSSREGRVLSVQSHTVHGYVGNKSAVFPLQLLGLDVDPVNSVQFSNHTGYTAGVRGQVLGGGELSALREGLSNSGILAAVPYTHLLTGYIGSLSFLEAVLAMLAALRAENPDLTYVCDPVLGDHGKLYVPEALVECYRDQVVPLATVLTPNQFECELLTGVRILSRDDAMRASDVLHGKGVRTVVITSIEYGKDGSSTRADDGVAEIKEEGGSEEPTRDNTDDNNGVNATHPTVLTVFASHCKNPTRQPERYELSLPKLEGRFTGTGDLSAALLLAWLYRRPDDVAHAVEKTMGTLQAVLARTVREGVGVGGAPPEIRLIQSKEDIEFPPRLAATAGASASASPIASCNLLVTAVQAPIEGIVFDMDGTLTMPEQLDFAGMRAAIGCPSGTDIIDHVKNVVQKDRAEGERLEKIVSSVELGAFEDLRLQPGMVRVLSEWQDAGNLRLGLSTRNCAEATNVFLEKSGLGLSFFDPLLVRYSLAVEKPRPEVLWRVSEEWDMHPSRILFVGDSKDDLRCARSAGCRFALVVGPSNGHLAKADGVDVVVQNFDELKSFVYASRADLF